MFEGFTDPILISTLNQAITNAMISWREGQSRSFDPRRDIDAECGFPNDSELTPDRLKLLYDRDPIAARVVEIWPKECWQVQPEIYETEDSSQITPFEQAIKDLSKTLISEPGYHKEEEGSPLNEFLLRADILSGIGRYGVIVLLIDDGKELSEPIEGIGTVIAQPDGSVTQQSESVVVQNALRYNLLGVRVFPESLAMISAREVDRKSPRYGMPTLYNITFDSPDDMTALGAGGMINGSVHWTRVVHIADNLSSSEIVGAPRIKTVINNVLSLQKLYGGSAEMFWKGAFPGLSFETHPQLGGDVSINRTEAKGRIENYMNGLQRYLLLTGMSAKPLAPIVADPTAHILTQIQAICIRLGVPVRIFMGSERGELASTQDDDAWNDRVKQRQKGYLTPRVICPFYNRLINIGVLPLPTNGYYVSWDDITSQSEEDKVNVGKIRTDMLTAYDTGGLSKYITPVDYLVRFLNLTESEARSYLDRAAEALVVVEPVVENPTPEPQPVEATPIVEPVMENEIVDESQETII